MLLIWMSSYMRVKGAPTWRWQVVGLRAGVDGGPSGSPPYVRAEMCSAISAVLQRQQEGAGGESLDYLKAYTFRHNR